jgi:MFS family permease
MRTAYAGGGAILAGVGLARFAYVPLFPAMVAAGWVDGAEAGLLGAGNFAGYLLGVLAGRRLAARIGVPRAMDAGMALAVLAFAACALQGGVVWLLAWRALAGTAGGVLMALAGPAVQASVPPERRGAASGIVMTGVGTGVIAGGLAVPLLLAGGLPLAWLGLAVATGLIWLAARNAWPDPPALPKEATQSAVPRAGRLLGAYALSGARRSGSASGWGRWRGRCSAGGWRSGSAGGGRCWCGWGCRLRPWRPRWCRPGRRWCWPAR